MKTTGFTNIHIELGAKMAPFAGYNMPISYSSITDEHVCVRERVGMFDVSHMGQFIVRGEGALALIQRISSNDAAALKIGKVQYSCLLQPDGGIVDDMLVYYLQENGYMLVVNASNIEKDWNWIEQHKTENVELIDISPRTSLLAVQGPKAVDALQSLTGMDLASMEYYTFEKGTFAGVENVLVSATGYTGSGGFEIYFEDEHSAAIWNAIMEAGQEYGLQPIGLGARDTLRLEKGFCLYGNDIDETTTPLEAGLAWITKFSKDFDAKEALLQQKSEGLKRRLVGFVLQERGIARHGYPIVDAEGNTIGEVTSGTQSPMLKESVALGYVPFDKRTIGSEILIQIRNKQVLAKVAKVPFV
ncbi:MAG: glycine cleavage system aminomethyltransferase GcvT [Chitinophagales bacterium]